MAEEATSESSTEQQQDQVQEQAGEPVDWQAMARKWEGQAKAANERAKANANAAKELERFRQSSMSEQEKAVEAAKAEGRAEALKAAGSRLVDAEVKAAVAGRKVDVDALLEGLDRSRFLSDDGEPDTNAITAWVDRIAPKPGVPDLGQGARGESGTNDMNSFIRQAAGRS